RPGFFGLRAGRRGGSKRSGGGVGGPRFCGPRLGAPARVKCASATTAERSSRFCAPPLFAPLDLVTSIRRRSGGGVPVAGVSRGPIGGTQPRPLRELGGRASITGWGLALGLRKADLSGCRAGAAAPLTIRRC